jgi:hypothetical protein
MDSPFSKKQFFVIWFHRRYEKEEGRRKYYLFEGLFVGLRTLIEGPIAYFTLVLNR